jgi:FlaA1/EpsC-like NDP-sugar epimerase
MGRHISPPKAKFALDLAVWTAAEVAAFMLRLDREWLQYWQPLLAYAVLGLPVKATLIYWLRLHHQFWSHVSVRDLIALLRAVGIGTLVMAAISFLMGPSLGVPRSIPLISSLLAMGLMAGARLTSRYLDERVWRERETKDNRRVLLVGAGEAGIMLARELLRHPEAGLEPVGFLDDNPAKIGGQISGLPVLGSIEDLPGALHKTAAREVIIALPSASGKVIRRVVEQARKAGVKHQIMPGLHEILSGKVSISQIREVNLEDLLRRDPVQLNLEEIERYIEGKAVLITGAGGSIGSEMVRQVLRFNPKTLALVGRGENGLFEMEQEIRRTWPEIAVRIYVADVRRADKMQQVFEQVQPQVVIHAAAHKHVPLMEANPDEAIFNNVGGTLNVVRCALEFGVERFVNISTDKAVNPTSVMGASKRVAEYIVSWAAARARPGQSFVSVRFGNVLGSRGSVVRVFKQQIKAGGPITVTHPDMTRYFMTIPEASKLVLQAAGFGENGKVYVLDMGEPVKIVDLAEDIIRLSGFEPYQDIDIVFSGMRPGEKLYEEILTAEEGTEATQHQQIYRARQEELREGLEICLEELFEAARQTNGDQTRSQLRRMIPNYVHYDAAPNPFSKEHS